MQLWIVSVGLLALLLARELSSNEYLGSRGLVLRTAPSALYSIGMAGFGVMVRATRKALKIGVLSDE